MIKFLVDAQLPFRFAIFLNGKGFDVKDDSKLNDKIYLRLNLTLWDGYCVLLILEVPTLAEELGSDQINIMKYHQKR